MNKINVFGKSFPMSNYGLVQFNRENAIHTTITNQIITDYDIDCLVCNAIEGGIQYWAGVNNVGENWSKDIRPEGVCLSEWISILLLSGKSVQFYDREDEKVTWELTLEKLINGIEMNCDQRPHDSDLENGDAITADCIFQYAMLGEIVYG